MNRAISLFSGAGGLDIGIGKAGFVNLCSIELDPHCVSTLRNNSVHSKKIWNIDIRAVSPSGLLTSLGLAKGDIELLHGGPPCQSFSQIGKRLELSDARGELAFEMLRFADEMRPKAVIIEQVANFVKAKFTTNATIVDEFSRRFELIGYKLFWRILDASEHGVAQRRKRAFLIAFRSDTIGTDRFTFPAGSDLVRSVSEVISDLPKPQKKGDLRDGIANHIDITPSRDRERIAPVLEGEWLSKSNAPKSLIGGLSKKDTTKFRRLARHEPSLTLRCGEIFFHPLEDRYITPREAARIHGYDDRYEFMGPIRGRTGTVRNLDQHRQVANSVPPPLAAAIGKSVRDALCL